MRMLKTWIGFNLGVGTYWLASNYLGWPVPFEVWADAAFWSGAAFVVHHMTESIGGSR